MLLHPDTIMLAFLCIVILAALRAPGRTSLFVEIWKWIRIRVYHAFYEDPPRPPVDERVIQESYLARVNLAVDRANRELKEVSKKSGKPERAKRARQTRKRALKSLAALDISGSPYEVIGRMLPMICELIVGAESCRVQVSPVLYWIRNYYLPGLGQLPPYPGIEGGQ